MPLFILGLIFIILGSGALIHDYYEIGGIIHGISVLFLTEAEFPKYKE